MEIRIRTYDEISSEQVKIEVALGQRIELVLDKQAIDPGTLGRLAGLEDLILDLEVKLAKAEAERKSNREWAERAEAERVKAENDMVLANQMVVDFRARVDLRDMELASARRRISGQANRIQGIREAVHNEPVTEALKYKPSHPGAEAVIAAIEKVRELSV